MSEKKEFISTRKGIKYLDLFAGAGGFSEGFMQAYTDDKYYDFRLASDINENCELTHRVRYNKMLGLDTKFICQDIMEDTFLPNLLKEIGNQEIDVITGGPSCQSFSLAGRRKKLDKRDDLFYHYLKVIKALRPKYFVMENVKGILTKDEGRIKERILREIRSIVDDMKMAQLYGFLDDNLKGKISPSLYSALYTRMCMETADADWNLMNEMYFNNLDQQLKDVTKNLPYNVSKSNEAVNTIRHGLILLKMRKERDEIRKQVIQLKTSAHIDNDTFVDGYNAIVEAISDEQILDNILNAIDVVAEMGKCEKEAKVLKKSLEVLTATFDECIDFVREQFADNEILLTRFEELMSEIRLYNITEPMVLLSSNYGVPQNSERVVFIGCRNVFGVLKKLIVCNHFFELIRLDKEVFSAVHFAGSRLSRCCGNGKTYVASSLYRLEDHRALPCARRAGEHKKLTFLISHYHYLPQLNLSCAMKAPPVQAPTE